MLRSLIRLTPVTPVTLLLKTNNMLIIHHHFSLPMDTNTAAVCEATWRETAGGLCTPDLAARWWQRIRDHYNEQQRHYHTLEHVKHMVNLTQTHSALLNDKTAVMLAIFFHDVIYDPKANDNEEKSAELFQEFARTYEVKISEEMSSSVFSWIIATKTHMASAGEKENSDLLHFLDMDLGILGTPREVYIEYANAIRKEYCHVPDQQFREGRTKVLETFLKVPHIYSTKTFRELYEDNARGNLAWEIEKLKTMNE